MITINYYPCLKVWFFEPASSVEVSRKHEVEDEGSAVDWQVADLVDLYEETGREVIEVRLLKSPVEPGDVLYHNRRF